MDKTTIDITRWNKKVDALLKAYGPTVEKIVAYGNTKVGASVIKNLSGSTYIPGTLPVRRITGTLARSYRHQKITPYLYLHKMDSSIANYAAAVHEGRGHMPRRPYFKDAFDSNRTAIMNYWRYQFILETRKIGRA